MSRLHVVTPLKRFILEYIQKDILVIVKTWRPSTQGIGQVSHYCNGLLHGIELKYRRYPLERGLPWSSDTSSDSDDSSESDDDQEMTESKTQEVTPSRILDFNNQSKPPVTPQIPLVQMKNMINYSIASMGGSDPSEKQLISCVSYVNGLKHGYAEIWFNGAVNKRWHYERGQRHGVQEWYSDWVPLPQYSITGTTGHQLIARQYRRNDKLHGLAQWWFMDGRLRAEGNFIDHRLDGMYKTWDWFGRAMETPDWVHPEVFADEPFDDCSV